MAKLRRNYNPQQKSGGKIFRVIGFLVMVALLMYYLYHLSLTAPDTFATQETDTAVDMLPESNTGQVIRHKHYTLSYDEAHEQAEWVAYRLSQASLEITNVPRATRFEEDPLVHTKSAHHRDYTRSGYTRGHLAPAGDMAFDEEAMRESFYMSNMSPQISAMNGGIWNELEETTRDWAYHNDEVYVVTGPVLTPAHIKKKIGKSSKVSVSDLFYRIVLDYTEPEIKAIAFLIPNELSEKPLQDYVVTIDEVEEVTGIDFFAGAFADEKEEQIESTVDVGKWKFSDKRYLLRVDSWNNR